MKKILLVSMLAIPLVTMASDEAVRCETELTKMDSKKAEYKPLETASIFALIANPEKYHGRRISVVGVFLIHFDRIALYATKDHLEADDFSSMIWVELPKCVTLDDAERMSEWQGMFVRIDGVFNAQHKNFAAGTMQQVELVKPWYTEAKKTK